VVGDVMECVGAAVGVVQKDMCLINAAANSDVGMFSGGVVVYAVECVGAAVGVVQRQERTSIRTAGPEGNPIYNIHWLAKEDIETQTQTHHHTHTTYNKHGPFASPKALVPTKPL